MNIEQNCIDLISAILYQAVKDYVSGSKSEQETILRELHAMGGRAIVVAEQLQNHENEIRERIKQEVAV